MWARTLVLFLLVQACTPQYLEDEAEEGYRNADFYDNFEETEASTPLLTTAPMDAYTRVRRFEKSERRTLAPEELRDVKDALRDIFGNRKMEAGVAADFTSTSPSSLEESTDKSTSLSDTSTDKSANHGDNSYNQTDQSYDHSEKGAISNNGSASSIADTDIKRNKDIPLFPTEDPIVSSTAYTSQQHDWMSTHQEVPVNGKKGERSVLREAVRGLSSRVETWQPMDPTNTILTTILEYLDNSTERTLSQEEIMEVEGALQRFIANQKRNTNSPLGSKNISLVMTDSPLRTNHSVNPEELLLSTSTEWQELTTDDEDEESEEESSSSKDPLRQNWPGKGQPGQGRRKKTKPPKSTKPWWKTKKTKQPVPEGMVLDGTFHTFPPGWPYKRTKCPTTDTTPFKLNVHGMMWLLSNLTYEYDMQLVERFNESLYKYSVPTCRGRGKDLGWGGPWGSGTTALDVDNTTVVAKCFVCGLKATHIPQDSYCADAFAGDFIPLVPVDPRARGHIARYRKYCRFADIRDSIEYPDQPRAVFGRFSPGCSVRWTDLTGVYTQRACRNKRRAVTGNHFGSKRMAKLEMALNHLENGCIVSPMATLLPLSRGISLYARFHACVCTGAWCNRAVLHTPWMVNIIFSFWLYHVLKSI